MNIGETSFAQKYDLLGCYQCGRCTSGCPVTSRSALNIRRMVREAIIRDSAETIFDKKEIWDCTTCSTCSIRCPRGLKPSEVIIGMRSILVEEGRVPTTAMDAMEGVFKHGNPWGKPRNKRSEWATSLQPANSNQQVKADVVFFVCCAAAYDPRIQEVARVLVKTFNHAGVSFAMLGNEESCCGNEMRRLGEEGLFEELVEKNMKLFQKVGAKEIVTISPHCFNALKNEYPKGEFQVKHYTQVLAELIDKGQLPLSKEVKKTITYHDPCFLGKQNGIFDEPRKIIQSIPGVTFVELDRSREKSLCCEGGGGRMWIEASEESGERLAQIRVKDALEVGAEILATACPFCVLTLEDSAKTAGDGKIQVMDILELVSMAI
ncbi:MAG: (Fe-S)-binding protein [Dehalococcoidia bacterium]|nr:(Fe-S)-binding protein [Dehalococcoidia bacterium]